jgi:hypothetical protein
VSIRETFNKALEALTNRTITTDQFTEAVNVIGVRDALFSTIVSNPELLAVVANLEIDREDSQSSSVQAVAKALDATINGASWSEVQVRDLLQQAVATDPKGNNTFAKIVTTGLNGWGYEDTIRMVASSFKDLSAEDHLSHAETLAELRK